MTGKKMFLTVFILMLAVAGVAYAADCNSGGRYEVNGYPTGNGTVTDCRTGLIWLQDANCTDNLGLEIDKSVGPLFWYDAMNWVAALGTSHCGLTDGSTAGDWRLPTKTEWMAMVAYAKGRYASPALTNAAGTLKWTADGDAFNNVQSDDYWSSTSTLTSNAWVVGMNVGNVGSRSKTGFFYCYVWPVRAGQSGTFGNLIIE